MMQRKMIDYIVVCINEFALSKSKEKRFAISMRIRELSS